MIGPDIINSLIPKESIEIPGRPDLKPLPEDWKPPTDIKTPSDNPDDWKPPLDIMTSGEVSDDWTPPRDIDISPDFPEPQSEQPQNAVDKNAANPEKPSTDTDDKPDDAGESTQKDANPDDAGESAQEEDDPDDPVKKKIEDRLNTPEGLQKLLEKHPELAERLQEIMDILNNPDATPAEKRSAQTRLNQLKGQLMEAAVKDVLAEEGLDVDEKQKQQDGEDGKTRPDVVATNNTDHPITVLGVTLQPGESISIECKCGQAGYLKSELANHIPNQLSGQEGHRVLLTTSDVKALPSGTAESVCDKYNANLVVLDISVKDVDNTLMNR